MSGISVSVFTDTVPVFLRVSVSHRTDAGIPVTRRLTFDFDM